MSARIYFWKNASFRLDLNHQKKIIISLVSGSILGLVAGIVGIGGGIYLIPIIMFRIGSPKEAAATATIFVWSVLFSGLVSRLQYNSIDLTQYMPLITAAIIGGFFGSYMGSFRFSLKAMEKILGLIILVAIAFLFKKLLF
ncbi:TSUP family transporter [Abyssogena phaseoliformis symbiont]|uniref:TSUP family transporter n=1 Tax=Abyssogena phaseoliformis symbiont TaxID=596095 RepID=UPI001CEDD3EB|nr:TSUP family transporter [Abyssogena phaseoliformis symbiont]